MAGGTGFEIIRIYNGYQRNLWSRLIYVVETKEMVVQNDLQQNFF